jgi:hypothetical protein
VPAWPLVERVASACGVADLSAARRDWEAKYRERLEAAGLPALAVEVRVLIAESAGSARAVSLRAGVCYCALTRDLRRIGRGQPVAWPRLERVLRGAGLGPGCPRWERVHAWWHSAAAGR